MGANKKVLVIIFVMLSVLSVATIMNVWVNFISYGKKTTIEKASSIAESVRDGLTAHMVLGAMDKRELFLHNMIKHQNVKVLRVIRSKKTIKEFGDGGLDTYKYDDIEKDVLHSAKTITKNVTKDGVDYIRITIPYIASKFSQPNCLQCHINANEGDVLGAITLELDLKELEATTMDTILKIVLISVVFLILAFFITSYYIKPYIKLFDDLEVGISKAYKGDFSHYVDTRLSDEAGGKVAKRLNELSDIFKFKKTIELDDKKENIYERLAYILENHFGLKEFLIFENDNTTQKRKIVYKSLNMNFLNDDFLTSKKSCRAFRTKTQVNSADFHKVCKLCYVKDKESMCIPFSISDELSLSLLIYFDSKEELVKVQEYVPIIKNYFELAEPVLQTKMLMEQLHQKSLKDPMTGLYNRRFLDQYIEFGASDKKQFSVMMIDIDYFKQVNDTYGHDVGDEVIKSLAKVMKNNLKGSDLAIRYGGEEFLAITFNITKEVSAKIANKIREDFSKEIFKVNGETFSKTLSVGLAEYEIDKTTPWEVIKYADVALYYAKEHGRNQVVEFLPEMYKENLI